MQFLRYAALALWLAGCSGTATHCGYDWNYGTQKHLVCETDFYHLLTPHVFAVYTYDKDGGVTPIFPAQSASMFSPVESLINSVPIP